MYLVVKIFVVDTLHVWVGWVVVGCKLCNKIKKGRSIFRGLGCGIVCGLVRLGWDSCARRFGWHKPDHRSPPPSPAGGEKKNYIADFVFTMTCVTTVGKSYRRRKPSHQGEQFVINHITPCVRHITRGLQMVVHCMVV